LPGKAEPVEAVAVEVTVVKRRGEALAPVGRQQLLRRGRDAGLSLSRYAADGAFGLSGSFAWEAYDAPEYGELEAVDRPLGIPRSCPL
jgi:hypothetical protein